MQPPRRQAESPLDGGSGRTSPRVRRPRRRMTATARGGQTWIKVGRKIVDGRLERGDIGVAREPGRSPDAIESLAHTIRRPICRRANAPTTTYPLAMSTSVGSVCVHHRRSFARAACARHSAETLTARMQPGVWTPPGHSNSDGQDDGRPSETGSRSDARPRHHRTWSASVKPYGWAIRPRVRSPLLGRER